MRKYLTLIAALFLVVSAVPANAAPGADVGDDPDFLPGACFLYTADRESELLWLLTIHDPGSACLDGFPFQGREITIDNLRDDLVWSAFGFDEGNVLQLKGVVASSVFGFDGAAVDAGTPATAFISPEYLRASGPVEVNFNIVGTQAPGDGIDIVQLTVRGLGILTTVDGEQARFTAAVHEEVAALQPSLSPTKVLNHLSLRTAK